MTWELVIQIGLLILLTTFCVGGLIETWQKGR